MSKVDIEPGHTSLKDFFYFINERHRIYVKRFIQKLPPPWTEDPILKEWKFTNVFRQLDRGTIALNRVLAGEASLPYGEIVSIPVTSSDSPLLLNKEDVELLNGQSVCIGSHGYPVISDGVTSAWPVHCLILRKKNGLETDHRNGNKLDNTRRNLRLVTHAQNLQSAYFTKECTNETGLPRFVHKHGNGYRGRFKLDNEYEDVGTFSTAEEASLAVKSLQEKVKYCTPDSVSLPDILRNVCIYRFFNLDIHAKKYGYIYELGDFETYLWEEWSKGEKIFTSAHMTSGVGGEYKIDTYVRASKEIWDNAEELTKIILEGGTLESAFNAIRKYYQVGPFVAYEIVSDLRWTPLLKNATDKLTWANLGPGCRRGLRRLGMSEELESLREIYRVALDYLEPHVRPHYDAANEVDVWFDSLLYPPFEMREVEHCLCELDKYMRVHMNTGRPRQRFVPYEQGA